MTNNTINNVPPELLERCAQYTPTLEKQEDRARALSELRAMLSAPSPAGVDGLEVVADVCGDGLGFLVGVLRSGHLFSAGESLCRLSDAQAIIDGLRGENERIRLNIAEYNEAIACYQSERDQHARRIGELEGFIQALLLAGNPLSNSAYNLAQHEGHALTKYECELLSSLRKQWDAALSAGKEGE